MQHIQASTGSFWTPSSGNYLLHIAPAAARVTGKTGQRENISFLCWSFWMAMAMHRYDTVRITQWKRSRTLLGATGCYHRVGICSGSNNQTPMMDFLFFFIVTSSNEAAMYKMVPNKQ
jgi:hypothetical protein